MAWNDPGRDDDPWSRGGQGPPDLDEAFRKFQQKLAGMFGGGGSSSGGGASALNWKTVGIVAVVLVLAYFGWGIYQLDEQERGVVFRFGKLQPEVELPGINWNPPIVDEVRKVNVTRVESHTHDASMLTEDENIVQVSLSVQYRIGNPMDYEVQVRDPRKSLEHATESALRHVVGSTNMDAVITQGRAALGSAVEERIQRYLNTYQTGIEVVTVNIDKSAPPNQVQAAFDDVQKAKEDEERAVNDASAYAEQVIPEARGDAEKARQEAEAYRDRVIAEATGDAERFSKLLVEYQLAPEVTRDRLYIDSLEKVLSQSSKTVVDVGDDNIMVLPLNRSDAGDPGAADDPDIRTIAGAATRDLDPRRSAIRRDGR